MSTVPNNEADTTIEAQSKPPFLRRVRIRGYKSIAFCDVTLEPLTILVGRNASGKSNFLDALAFLRDVLDDGVNSALENHGGMSLFSQELKRVQSVSKQPITTSFVILQGVLRSASGINAQVGL